MIMVPITFLAPIIIFSLLTGFLIGRLVFININIASIQRYKNRIDRLDRECFTYKHAYHSALKSCEKQEAINIELRKKVFNHPLTSIFK